MRGALATDTSAADACRLVKPRFWFWSHESDFIAKAV